MKSKRQLVGEKPLIALTTHPYMLEQRCCGQTITSLSSIPEGAVATIYVMRDGSDQHFELWTVVSKSDQGVLISHGEDTLLMPNNTDCIVSIDALRSETPTLVLASSAS